MAIPVPVSGCQNTPQHEHQSPSSISTCTAIADWYATPKNAVEACICCVLSCYPNILSWVASGRSLVLPLELNALALGNFSIRLGGVNGRRLSESMSLALWLGNIPPNRREMLKSERLPQTRQLSCGQSLTTSHSAQSTAFCKEIEFNGRSSSARILTTELFILTSEPDINCTE